MRVGLSSLARTDLGGSIVERNIGKSERIPTSLGRHVEGVQTGSDLATSWRGSNLWLGLVWWYINLHFRGIFHQILGGGDRYLSFSFMLIVEGCRGTGIYIFCVVIVGVEYISAWLFWWRMCMVAVHIYVLILGV